ncbi:MAG: nuclear transport factor 2 family protein [Pseudomonadota bacterium]|nr:nuclear transport factor 2 family protein [Pseudomonadota bacterium]
MYDRRAAITRTIADYFDGLYFSDAGILARVFHPKAHYVCASEQPMLYRDMDEYLAIVSARPSPASRNEIRRDCIEEIQFAGPATAFARVRCAIGERLFTDFLTLVLVDGRWRIISKVFHFEVMSDVQQVAVAVQ